MSKQEIMDEFDGPVCYHDAKNRSRSCTDVPMCFGFLFFIAFMAVTGIVALVFGAPLRLLYGHDSFGNICGANNDPIESRSFTGEDMTNKPYVFFFDITKPRKSLKICVSKCPNRRLDSLRDLEDFAVKTGSTLCRYGVPSSDYGQSDIIHISAADCAGIQQEDDAIEIITKDKLDGCTVKIHQQYEGYGNCPVLPVHASFPLLNRCAPSKWDADTELIFDFYAYLNSFDFFSQVMADLYASNREIIGLALATFVLAVFFLLIFHFFPSIASHVVVVSAIIGSIVATSLLWWAWASLKNSLDSRLHFGQYDVLREETKNELILLIFALTATVLTVFLFCLLFVLRKRLNLTHVVRMFSEGSQCIKEVPLLLVLPLASFFALSVFFLFWVFVMLCLATSDFPRFVKNEITFKNYSMNIAIPWTSFSVIEYDDHTFVRFLWILFAFALIWVSEFILGCQQMVVAGAVSMWYFEREKKNCRSPIWSSIRQTVIFHLGSVAMGSLLITIFKIPRLIMVQLRILLRGRNSRPVDCFNTCCRPCWWFFERFLRYISHNAYGIVSLQGINFFPAGDEAYQLLSESGLPMVGVNCVGTFISFLGKCAVTAFIASIGIISMKHDPQLHLFAIPLLLCCVFAYFIAHSVISLYEMVLDTIFLCYCEDLRMNDACWSASDKLAYDDEGDACFASDSLREFMKTQLPTSNDVNLEIANRIHPS